METEEEMVTIYQCEFPDFNGCAVFMGKNFLVFWKYGILSIGGGGLKKYDVSSIFSDSSEGEKFLYDTCNSSVSLR